MDNCDDTFIAKKVEITVAGQSITYSDGGNFVLPERSKSDRRREHSKHVSSDHVPFYRKDGKRPWLR